MDQIMEISPEEKDVLEEFFGVTCTQELLEELQKNGLSLYNICELQGGKVWFRIWPPKAQLAFTIVRKEDGFCDLYPFNGPQSNNEPVHISSNSEFIDFISTEAGKRS
jgi:hypothetical protein